MADTLLNRVPFTIRLRRMLASALASLHSGLQYEGEPAYSTDTKQLYVSDGTTMNRVGGVDVFDTLANVLLATPARGRMALATDTGFLYIGNGSNWKEIGIVITKSASPNIGLEQDSPLSGYDLTWITDKALSNCRILDNANSTVGSVKTVSGKFYVYLNSVWNEIVINFRFREDPDGTYTMEHMPIGLLQWIEIMSGNSNDLLALNGKPSIQQYNSSMGAYPVDLVIDGGSL